VTPIPAGLWTVRMVMALGGGFADDVPDDEH